MAKNKNNSVLTNVRYVFSDMAHGYKPLLAIVIARIIIEVLTPYIGIHIPQLLVETVMGENSFYALILAASASAVLVGIKSYCITVTDVHTSSFSSAYLSKLLKKYLTCDYSVLETESGQAMYKKALSAVAKGGDYGTGVPGIIYASTQIAHNLISFLVYTIMLIKISPFITIIFVLLSFIDATALNRARKYENSRRHEYGDYLNKADYLEKSGGDVKAGKDLRLYGMNERFKALWSSVIKGYRDLLWCCKLRHALADSMNGFSAFARNLIAYGYLISLVAGGSLSVGEFVLYFGAISQFSNILRNIAYFSFRINLSSIQVSELREFLEMQSKDTGGKKIKDTTLIPKIEFRNVTFKYDGASEPVLENFNLILEPGEKLAIVGVNGAGKTTVVKLLCGFYTPTSGDILIDGISTRELDKKEIAKLYSVIFQEAVVLPFSLAENISMQPSEETNYSRVWDSLEKADLMRKVRSYPKTMTVNMTREIDENGIMLSGGELQKLLMARALYKNAPVLILDEPTAALDPIAESETYEKFNAISEGKTAVYISHRLASTRFCDRIVLISGKSIAESGTHEELMLSGSIYAKMFEVQKKYYK